MNNDFMVCRIENEDGMVNFYGDWEDVKKIIVKFERFSKQIKYISCYPYDFPCHFTALPFDENKK